MNRLFLFDYDAFKRFVELFLYHDNCGGHSEYDRNDESVNGGLTNLHLVRKHAVGAEAYERKKDKDDHYDIRDAFLLFQCLLYGVGIDNAGKAYAVIIRRKAVVIFISVGRYGSSAVSAEGSTVFKRCTAVCTVFHIYPFLYDESFFVIAITIIL